VPRLVQLLAEWTDKFPYDFRDERVMAHVREITHQCVSVEPAVRHQVSAMLQTLLHRLTALDKYETFLQQTGGTDATVGFADALSPVSFGTGEGETSVGIVRARQNATGFSKFEKTKKPGDGDGTIVVRKSPNT